MTTMTTQIARVLVVAVAVFAPAVALAQQRLEPPPASLSSLTGAPGSTGEVFFNNGSGGLGRDADLTFSGDTLTATKIAGTTFVGHALFSADNTYDIGASGATRPATGWFGTALSAPKGRFGVNGTVTAADNYSLRVDHRGTSWMAEMFSNTGFGLLINESSAGGSDAPAIAVYHNSAATQKFQVRWTGVVQWFGSTEPTCNAGNRGAVVLVAGGAGVADTFRICTKDAADAYAYRAMF